MKRSSRTAAWRVGLALAACWLVPAAVLAQGRKVTIGINSLTAIYWPTYIARDKGLVTQHGLDADVILVGSPVSGVQQLIGKSIDIAHPTLYVAVNAVTHGADMTLIGCIVNTLPYSMVASPRVASTKDLTGKSAILAFRTDVMTLMWRDWVKTQGVDPDGIDNRDEAIMILSRDTKQDKAIATATYEDYVLRQKPYDRALDLPDSFLKRTLDGAIELGDAPKGTTLPATIKNLSFRPT